MTIELPHHEPAAALVAVYPRWTLRMQRSFPDDRNAVWDALTDPDMLAQWSPFRPDRNLASTGPVRITQIDGSGEVFDSEVREETSLEVISFLWGSDQLRFGLSDSQDGGTTLTVGQVFDDRNSAASIAAGWHLCFDALELLLAGKDVPSVVGENAKQFGWDELEEQYAAMFHDQNEEPRERDDDETEE